MSKPYRPRAETLHKLVAHLEELGLSVYGPSMDDDGFEWPSLSDYDSNKILLRRKLIDKDQLQHAEPLS